ncbi:MAG TPA: hypothetical protein DEB39_09685, partial [Planctomycetaceae bacterium]|nr:hypothetical protein [Planctomycetaceae bacterium]
MLFARFYARSATEGGQICPLFEKNGSPYTKSLSRIVDLTRQWKEYGFHFEAKEDYDAGQARAGIHLGYQKQLVEIADFSILNFGQNFDKSRLPQSEFSYQGREANAAWRKEAERRIEKI